MIPVRSLIWRLGRRAYMWARHEHERLPHRNGEYWLLETVVQRAPQPGAMTFLDIGANRGNWTAEAVAAVTRRGVPGMIHAFEPSPDTYDAFTLRFAGTPAVHAHRLALSDRVGAAPFYVAAPLSGLNSLHPGVGQPGADVTIETVDTFLARTGVTHIDLVKCDAEGHDLTVLKGAQASLQSGRIDVWQFEYNHRWLANHACLKDVFDLIEGLPYRLARLHARGLAYHEAWHPELDRFFQAHWVLIRRTSPCEPLGHPVAFTTTAVSERVHGASIP